MRRAALVLAALSLLVAACAERPRPARMAATASRAGGPTVYVIATPTPTPAPTPPPVRVDLETVARTLVILSETVQLPPLPSSPFATFPPGDLVVFDTRNGTARSLGPGRAPSFSSSGRYLLWEAGAASDAQVFTRIEDRVFDTVAGAVLPLALKYQESPRFVGDEIFVDTVRISLPSGVVERGSRPVKEPNAIPGAPGVALERFGERLFVQDTSTSGDLFTIAATFVGFDGVGGVVVRGNGRVGDTLWFIDARSGNVTLALRSPSVFDYAVVTPHFIAWQNLCSAAPGNQPILVYDRMRGTAYQLVGDYPLVLSGRPVGDAVGLGVYTRGMFDFGARGWTTVFPAAHQVDSWSPDGRFAASGRHPAQTGFCGPG